MDTEQEERPKGVRRSESGAEDTVNTPDGEVFEENKAGKGRDEQERQRKLHALKVTEAIARNGKSQGDQVAQHPRLLNRGEPTSRKDDPKPPRMEATIPTRREQANTAKARLRRPRPREQNKKMERFSISMLSEKRRLSQSVERENGQQKEERHDRDDSAYDQTRREPVPSQNSKKIAKLDSFN